jgi:ABC-2 type transport system ATP-binding protein
MSADAEKLNERLRGEARPPEAERRVAIEVRELGKVFTSSFTQRKKWVVKKLDLDVYEGEVFGFLGPNGAGKTTTIKLMLGLLSPTAGTIRLFGMEPSEPAARRRVGFLPENPSFYDCLSLGEFLRLGAALSGLTAKREVERRVAESLFLSRLVEEENTKLRKFSKGMLQRAGLAQALIGDPKLLILDEPLSGLDPIGRKEIRDAIVRLREEGKTVFFSSHIIPDVELICDRVGIINEGRLERTDRVNELAAEGTRSVEIAVKDLREEAVTSLQPFVERLGIAGEATILELKDAETATMVLGKLAREGAQVLSVTPHKESLESVFVKEITRNSPRQRRGRLAVVSHR